jgi:hypothetical protein
MNAIILAVAVIYARRGRWVFEEVVKPVLGAGVVIGGACAGPRTQSLPLRLSTHRGQNLFVPILLKPVGDNTPRVNHPRNPKEKSQRDTHQKRPNATCRECSKWGKHDTPESHRSALARIHHKRKSLADTRSSYRLVDNWLQIFTNDTASRSVLLAPPRKASLGLNKKDTAVYWRGRADCALPFSLPPPACGAPGPCCLRSCGARKKKQPSGGRIPDGQCSRAPWNVPRKRVARTRCA